MKAIIRIDKDIQTPEDIKNLFGSTITSICNAANLAGHDHRMTLTNLLYVCFEVSVALLGYPPRMFVKEVMNFHNNLFSQIQKNGSGGGNGKKR